MSRILPFDLPFRCNFDKWQQFKMKWSHCMADPFYCPYGACNLFPGSLPLSMWWIHGQKCVTFGQVNQKGLKDVQTVSGLEISTHPCRPGAKEDKPMCGPTSLHLPSCRLSTFGTSCSLSQSMENDTRKPTRWRKNTMSNAVYLSCAWVNVHFSWSETC